MTKLKKSAVWKFSTIPTSVFESDQLSIYDKMLLACLIWHGDGDVWPAIPRLARMAGCGERAIRESMRRLIAQKIIRVVENRPGYTRVLRLDREPSPTARWLTKEIDAAGVVSEKQDPGIRKAGVPPAGKQTNESNLNESKKREMSADAPDDGAVAERKKAEMHQVIEDWSDTYLAVVKSKPLLTGKQMALLKRMMIHYGGAERLGRMIGNFFHPTGRAVRFTVENFFNLGDKLYQETKRASDG